MSLCNNINVCTDVSYFRKTYKKINLNDIEDFFKKIHYNH